MDNRKKQLREEYRQRRVVGGVCRMANRETGRYHLYTSDDVTAAENSFRFAASVGSCNFRGIPALLEEWKTFGPAAFEFSVVEMLEQKDTQTRQEFLNDLEALLELCREQADGALSYSAMKKGG